MPRTFRQARHPSRWAGTHDQDREDRGSNGNSVRGDAGDELSRVLIASDVRLYREGLAAALAGLGRLSIVGTVAGSDLTLACLSHFGPDVVLLDMALSGCLGLPAALRSEPPVRFVAFAVSEADDGVLPARRQGSPVTSGKTVPLRTSS